MTSTTSTELNIAAEKERVRDLFKQWDAFQEDPRQYDEGEGVYDRESPEMKWLEDTGSIVDELIRMYICHVASEDWLFNSITLKNRREDSFDSVDGERKMYEDLRNWADS